MARTYIKKSPVWKEDRTRGPMDSRRALDAAEMFKAGATMEEIGLKYGISRERARQILAQQGLRGRDGGQRVRAAESKKASLAARENRMLMRHGCTVMEWKSVLALQGQMLADGYGLWQTPLYAFRGQRRNAKTRGIEWSMSFKEWWNLWVESGHWFDRGRGFASLYVMCRHGDEGPYSVENVYIGTNAENRGEYFAGLRAKRAAAKTERTR